MIKAEAITINGKQTVMTKYEGDSSEIGTELAAIIATILQGLEPADGVTIDEMGHGLMDIALEAIRLNLDDTEE